MGEDNYSQWEEREADQERRIAKLPICVHCEQPIQDDRAWRVNDELYCESCAEEEFKVWTEDYIT